MKLLMSLYVPKVLFLDSKFSESISVLISVP